MCAWVKMEDEQQHSFRLMLQQKLQQQIERCGQMIQQQSQWFDKIKQLQEECVRTLLGEKSVTPCKVRALPDHMLQGIENDPEAWLQGSQIKGVAEEIQSVDGQLLGWDCEEIQPVAEGKGEDNPPRKMSWLELRGCF